MEKTKVALSAILASCSIMYSPNGIHENQCYTARYPSSVFVTFPSQPAQSYPQQIFGNDPRRRAPYEAWFAGDDSEYDGYPQPLPGMPQNPQGPLPGQQQALKEQIRSLWAALEQRDETMKSLMKVIQGEVENGRNQKELIEELMKDGIEFKGWATKRISDLWNQLNQPNENNDHLLKEIEGLREAVNAKMADNNYLLQRIQGYKLDLAMNEGESNFRRIFAELNYLGRLVDQLGMPRATDVTELDEMSRRMDSIFKTMHEVVELINYRRDNEGKTRSEMEALSRQAVEIARREEEMTRREEEMQKKMDAMQNSLELMQKLMKDQAKEIEALKKQIGETNTEVKKVNGKVTLLESIVNGILPTVRRFVESFTPAKSRANNTPPQSGPRGELPFMAGPRR